MCIEQIEILTYTLYMYVYVLLLFLLYIIHPSLHGGCMFRVPFWVFVQGLQSEVIELRVIHVEWIAGIHESIAFVSVKAGKKGNGTGP